MTVVDAVESQTPQVCRLVAENLDLQFSEDCICPRAPAHREWKVPGNAVPLGPFQVFCGIHFVFHPPAVSV